VAVASAGLYANYLDLAADRYPRQHLITQFSTGRMLFLTPSQQCQSTEGNVDITVNVREKPKEFLLSENFPSYPPDTIARTILFFAVLCVTHICAVPIDECFRYSFCA